MTIEWVPTWMCVECDWDQDDLPDSGGEEWALENASHECPRCFSPAEIRLKAAKSVSGNKGDSAHPKER